MVKDIFDREYKIGDHVAFAYGHQSSGDGGGWLVVMKVTSISEDRVSGDIVKQIPGISVSSTITLRAPERGVILH